MTTDRGAELLALLRQELEGRYTVERELARGAMARVYVARDPAGATVALKVLPPELASGTNAERFLREIQITRELRHPNILPLLDSGVENTHYWYVMPFLPDESLRDRLRSGGPLPLDEVLTLAAEVTDALSYAHGRGVVHRDLKPENLMRSDGRWMVLDFGLARAVESDGRLTGTGMPLGTPAYMSPEQIAGAAAVDARSDLYGLGCVLYETMTGRPPFVHGSIVQVLRSHVHDRPVPPSTVRPELPAAFDAPILRALAKSPDHRPASAADLARELEQAAAGAATSDRSDQPGLLARWFGRKRGG